MFRQGLTRAVLAGAVLFTGCAANRAVVATSTTLGISASTDKDAKTHASIAYERFEGVVIPLSVAAGPTKVLPVAAVFETEVGELELKKLGAVRVMQILATGDAATGTATSASSTKKADSEGAGAQPKKEKGVLGRILEVVNKARDK